MNRSEAFRILGVDRNSTADEIKTAYRKLAMIHHPDRGGDSDLFKQVKEAFEFLDKPEHGEYFYQDRVDSQGPLNRRVNITVSITEAEALNGCIKNIVLSVNPRLEKQLKINPGVGEDRFVTVFYEDSGIYFIFIKIKSAYRFTWGSQADSEKRGDVFKDELISPFKLILGGWHEVKTLDGSTVTVRIPPGLEANKLLKIKDKGYLKRENGMYRGDLYLKVIPDIKKKEEYSSQEIQDFIEAKN